MNTMFPLDLYHIIQKAKRVHADCKVARSFVFMYVFIQIIDIIRIPNAASVYFVGVNRKLFLQYDKYMYLLT